MYTVNLKDISTGEVKTIHDVIPVNPTSCLTSAKISDAINEISSFTFDILPNNIGFNFIHPFRTQVEIYNNKTKKYVFKGRVLIPTVSMYEDGKIVKNVTCESFLGYLNDVHTPIAEEKTYTLDEFIDLLLDYYNSKVETHKRIYKGIINVTTFESSNTVTKSLDGTQTIWDAIKDKLINSFGGEIQMVEDSQGILYLNYVQQIGEVYATPTIEVGKNMKTAKKEIDPTSIYTRLYPYGAKLTTTYENEDGETVEEELEERLTIESVNNGLPYIEDTEAYDEFKTTIEHVEIFDDITIASNLLAKGQQWLANNNKIQQKHTISYADLFKLGIDEADIELYNYYPVKNPLIGLDETLRVIKKTTDIINQNSSSIDVGDVFKTLTDIEVERAKQVVSTINTVQKINKNYTTNFDLSNLKNYMTSYIDQTAENVKIGVENIISLADYIKTIEGTNYLHLEKTQASKGMVYSLSIKGFLETTNISTKYNIVQVHENIRTTYSNEILTFSDNITYDSENEEITLTGDFVIEGEEIKQVNISSDVIILSNPLQTLTVEGITYYDEIVIENNVAYIYRNIGLDENGNKILLNSTVIEKYGTLQIDTFNGNTYIYIENFDDLLYSSTYIQENPFTEKFMTQLEGTSSFDVTSKQIESKVNKDGIISTINQSAELIKILAKKLQLEGYTTINGGFSVDEQGNASIANGSVNINTKGIQMADGTSLIGGKGIFTMLTFKGCSESYSEVVGQGEFQYVGFNSPYNDELRKCNYYIDVFIPHNFKTEKAYLTIQHLPLIVYEGETQKGYGVCKQMKFYNSDISNKKLYFVVMSDSGSSSDTDLKEIPILGASGWSPTIPANEDSVSLEEMTVEIPIKNFVSGKINRFALSSSIETPTVGSSDYPDTIGCLNSGAIIGTINLIGFSKDVKL